MRGTTPTHVFKLPFDVGDIKSVMVIYAQNDKEILRKNTDECTLLGNNIAVMLTQQDTLQFDHKYRAQVQVRCLKTDGTALASRVRKVTVEQCLNDEVLT